MVSGRGNLDAMFSNPITTARNPKARLSLIISKLYPSLI